MKLVVLGLQRYFKMHCAVLSLFVLLRSICRQSRNSGEAETLAIK